MSCNIAGVNIAGAIRCDHQSPDLQAEGAPAQSVENVEIVHAVAVRGQVEAVNRLEDRKATKSGAAVAQIRRQCVEKIRQLGTDTTQPAIKRKRSSSEGRKIKLNA